MIFDQNTCAPALELEREKNKHMTPDVIELMKWLEKNITDKHYREQYLLAYTHWVGCSIDA